MLKRSKNLVDPAITAPGVTNPSDAIEASDFKNIYSGMQLILNNYWGTFCAYIFIS